MDETQGQLFVHTDEEGLALLIRELEGVRAEYADPAGFKPAHTHLMTPAWGGSELTDEAQGEGEVINHVKIYCWPPPDA